MIKFIKNLFKKRKQSDTSVVSVSVCPNCKGSGYISSDNAISLCLLCGGKQSDTSVVSCSVCGGQDILHEQKEGRGLPPKGWVRKMGDNRRISWRGTWNVWTCKSCGETWRKLR